MSAARAEAETENIVSQVFVSFGVCSSAIIIDFGPYDKRLSGKMQQIKGVCKPDLDKNNENARGGRQGGRFMLSKVQE